MYHQFKMGLCLEIVYLNVNLKTSYKDVDIWPEGTFSLL